MRSVRDLGRLGIVLVFASLTSLACGDDDTSPPDPPVVSVDLLAPLGGETWGASGTIRWQSQNATDQTVKLLLSDDSGASYPETLATGLPHTSSHEWTLWARADGATYRIRVDLLDESQVLVDSDASASDFTIDNPESRLLIADIDFADANLEAAVVATGHTYADEVTRVDGREQGIADLSGIEFLVNLDTLRILGNSVVDLTPLAGLTEVLELDLYRNLIVDLTPLAGLTALQTLRINENPVTDLSPLAGLTTLIHLETSYLLM